MAKGLLPFLPMIVFFAGSRFLAPFTMSNPGELLAIRGAELFGTLHTPDPSCSCREGGR